MSLSAKEILAAAALRTEPVEIDGGTVIVREFSVALRGEFVERARTKPKDLSAWIVSQCAVGEDGKRLFDDEAVQSLAETSPRIVDVIGQAALKLSGMTREDEDDDAGES